MRASIELIEMRGNVLEDLERWVHDNRNHPPDLIVIDHVFTPALPFGLKGSSVAHLLRGVFPGTPMVCVSAMFARANAFDQEGISDAGGVPDRAACYH